MTQANDNPTLKPELLGTQILEILFALRDKVNRQMEFYSDQENHDWDDKHTQDDVKQGIKNNILLGKQLAKELDTATNQTWGKMVFDYDKPTGEIRFYS